MDPGRIIPKHPHRWFLSLRYRDPPLTRLSTARSRRQTQHLTWLKALAWLRFVKIDPMRVVEQSHRVDQPGKASAPNHPEPERCN